ncbi:proline iminopeptidase [Filimonas lacunae]|uniref:Proline iminopeptidase n=2 Tax=Filimonas lacunae TaxID=477680 RepID=A0A1N7REN7_9BACT|nr:proline iminopeptidase [Filimonas lacunae]
MYLKKKTAVIASMLWLVLLASCSAPGKESNGTADYFVTDTTTVQTGGAKMVPITTRKGVFHVWTKRIGNNPNIKVMLLSGGPGFPHDYLEVFESYFPGQGIEFYYYDEMGNGNSDKPGDSSRYNVASAVEELELVRQALHLDKENFYLFGHSWGGLLAMEYAAKYQRHLKAIIVSNMVASGQEFNRYIQQVLVKEIPKVEMDTINAISARNDYGNPKYMELVMKNFYAQHICRMPLEQWPEPLNRALGKLNAPYYMALQGPSELGIIGSLRNWDISTRLKDITIPALFIGAKYDEMDPEHIKWMSQQVQHGQFLYCANGSHLSMYDQQSFYMNGVIHFIKEVNNTP